MDDLRIKAMDYALQARANASEDIVELARRIHEFLSSDDDYVAPPDFEALSGITDVMRGVPPPLPDHLVEQVAADAKPSQLGPESLSGAPPGMRGQDLSNADQSPKTLAEMVAETARRPVGFADRFDSEDDTKTRIISRT